MRTSSNQQVAATGNWWGAVDGPSADGPGTGDGASGNIDFAGFLIDGTEFSYFDAGGVNHFGYGISPPNSTGIASSDWGGDPTRTFLYNIDEQQIRLEYTGLLSSSSYDIFITYLNQDTGGSKQSLRDINEQRIHEAFSLPSSNPVQYRFPIPANSIDGSNLTLDLIGISGLRTVFSSAVLIKNSQPDNVSPTIQITSPVGGELLPSAVHVIAGVADDIGVGLNLVEVGIQKTGGALQWYPVTSINSEGEWYYQWSNPASGEYTITGRATDSNGNLAVSEAKIVMVDGIIPAPVSGLFVQTILDGTEFVRLTWVKSADDGAGENDVDRYEIFRNGAGLLPEVLIGQVVNGIVQFDDNAVSLGPDYYYLVRTLDAAGNFADTGVFGPVSLTGIADITPPEDVTGLSAQATQHSGSDTSVFLNWSGSANSEGDLIDQRLYISTDGISFGNNNPDYTNGLPISLGRDLRNYQVTNLAAGINYDFLITTIDEVLNESSGASASITPSGAESEIVTLTGTLSSDLSLANGVFYIPSNLTVPFGTTLTLGPSTVLKFGGSRSLTIHGTLFAFGDETNPIVLTSFTDDEHGGDSNGNGASSGTPGYWNRLYFENTSTSQIDHAVIRYGGSGNQGNIYMFRSSITITSSDIINGSSYGVYTYESSTLIESCTIANHTNHGLYLFRSSSPSVSDNEIHNNTNGIYVQSGATPIIDGNTIHDNSNYGVFFADASNTLPLTDNIITNNLIPALVPASAIPDDTNVLTPNTQRVIGIRGNNIQTDKRLRVWDDGSIDEISTYIIYTSDITIPIFTFLTIDPGVIIKFASNVGIQVNGALISDGTIDDKIVFTSFKDDIYAGDTNGDGSASTPQNGDWHGITFNNSFYEESTVVNHTKLHYAGSNGSGALYCFQANISIQNTEISNSSSNGIRIWQASPEFIGNNIWGNFGDGIRVEQLSNVQATFNRISTNLSDGMEILSSSNVVATNNQFIMNRGYGILNSTSNAVDATNSWWGESDG